MRRLLAFLLAEPGDPCSSAAPAGGRSRRLRPGPAGEPVPQLQ